MDIVLDDKIQCPFCKKIERRRSAVLTKTKSFYDSNKIIYMQEGFVKKLG